jgi:hypothetical protein
MPCTCCSPSSSSRWAAYGGHKPKRPPARPRPRPERPVEGRRYPELEKLIGEAKARGDPQRKALYDWEDSIIQVLPDDGLLSAETATGYVAWLWLTYAKDFEPFFTGVPTVHLLTGNDVRGWAIAKVRNHAIYIDARCCRKSWLCHEVLHLMRPGHLHDATFAAGLTFLWEREFEVSRRRAFDLAADNGVSIDINP